MMNKRTQRALGRGAMSAISFGAVLGLVLAFMGLVPIPEVRWKLPAKEAGEYLPESRLSSGEELAIVFVGSSACAWSNRPELTRVVKDLKTTLAARASAAGIGFSAVGVARDIVAERGIAHLAKFGRFDEVMSGRGWANTGIQKYLYTTMPGPGATPQILVLARSLDFSTGHVAIVDERVLARKVGLKEITAWADEGAALGFRADFGAAEDPAEILAPALDQNLPDRASALRLPTLVRTPGDPPPERGFDPAAPLRQGPLRRHRPQ